MAKRLKYEDVKNYIEMNSNCKLLSQEYINAFEKMELLCFCGKHFLCNFASIKRKEIIQCPDCSREMVNKKNSKTYKEAFEDIKKNISENLEILPFEYKGTKHTNVSFYCKRCNEQFSRTYHQVYMDGTKCPKCESRTKKWDIERAIELVKKYSNDFDVLECNKASTIVLKHKECGYEFIRPYHNIEQNKCVKCPICHNRESMGVKIITQYLENNNINFIKEFRFENCKDTRTLPFDFYLSDYNICIEYDGQQHFQPLGFSSSFGKFEKTIEHDKIKNDYCKENNIPLLRIKYDENENIKQILDNFLNTLIPR